MIIVRLNGGLGNQLFQYAAGYSLAQRNKDILKIDLSGFKLSITNRQARRNPDILQFKINALQADSELIRNFKYPYGYLSIFLRFFSHRILKRYYSDWHPKILNLKGDIYLEGYFQCEKYFFDYFDLLIKELELHDVYKEQISDQLKNISKLTQPVSLHVRRGDYISDPKTKLLHDICTVDYYQNALSIMKDKLGEINLIVFSDDVSWVRENLLLGNNVTYISDVINLQGERYSAPQELVLMSQCHHHIVSNSTFSWWGAYLNRRSDKIVIAPNIWNRSRVDSHKNILPASWLTIPVEYT